MNEMLEIVRLIVNVGLKQIDGVFGDTESSLFKSFFEGLASGEFENDEIAAQQLYNSTPSDERYRKLKLRLREKLFEVAPFINFAPPFYSTLRHQMYECNREQTAMKQCIENGAQSAGYKIANKLLKKARQYHLTVVELECLYVVFNHLISCTGDEKKYKIVREELRNVQQKLNAETEAELLYGEVSIKYAVINSDHPENAPLVEDCLRQFEDILSKQDTFKIRYSYYMLRSLQGQIKRDFRMRIKACDEAIEYFKKHPQIAGNLLGIFTLEKAECYFHFRQYDVCLQIISKCEKYFQKTTSNWLILKSYEVLSLLCLGNSLQAFEVFKAVRKILYRSSGGVSKYNERWLVVEGYIYFFLHTELPNVLPEKSVIPSLHNYLHKLLVTKIDSLSEDKDGANIGVMILHVILLLGLKSNPSDISERIDALDRYRRRYLEYGVNERTDTFIRILRQLYFENFDVHRTNILMKNYLDKLSPTGNRFIEGVEDYEVIGYDIVWDRIVKFYAVSSRPQIKMAINS